MKYRNTLLGLAAAALLGVVSSVQAAPTVSFRLEIGQDDGAGNFTTAGVDPLALQPNHDYLVALYGTVNNPNFTTTATDRATATRNKALGFQTVALCINSATAGVIHPVADPAPTSPPKWDTTTINNYAANTALGVTGLSVFDPSNLIDENSNAEVDVAGTGFSNTSLSAANATQLANCTVGAGAEGQLLVGLYHTGNGGASILSTFFQPAGSTVTKLTVFNETPATGNGLQADDVDPATIVNAQLPIGIIAIPEPMTISLAGIGLGLLGIRRRRA
ncbi:MAG TPA: PEP-CTERM sorting domain-containing protein [Tepidisphaeraceae bacterium]|jgi:hypothetical protein